MNDLFNITCSHLKLIPGFALSYLEIRRMFSPDYEVIVVAVDLTTQPVFYYLPLLFGDCTVKKYIYVGLFNPEQQYLSSVILQSCTVCLADAG